MVTDGHCEETQLAAIALGAQPPNQVFARHMQTCLPCREKSEQMAEVVNIARTSLNDRAYSMPPGVVWASITANAGDAGSQPDLFIEGLDEETSDEALRSSHRGWWFAVAAAIVILLVVLGVVFLQ